MEQVDEQARQQAVLFLAALLAPRRELDYRARSAVLAHAHFLVLHPLANRAESLRTVFLAAGITRALAACFRPSAFEQAKTLAAEWRSLGVRTIETRKLGAPFASFYDHPPLWFVYGKRKLLSRPAVAVLNSRKPRCLSPRDPWIATTKAMVGSAVQRGFAVVSSYGTPPYDLASTLAKGSPLVVVCDDALPFMGSTGALRGFMSAYGDLFDHDHTVFVSGFPPGRMPGRAERYSRRDHYVAALSSMLLVADVRSGGNMASILSVAEQRGMPVLRSPLTEERQEKGSEECPRAFTVQTNDALGDRRSKTAASTKPSPLKWPTARQVAWTNAFLLHYTRSCAGPWPGQTVAAYCRTLIEGSPGAEHKGFDSLVRILEEGTIRASHKLTRGTVKVICLTELFPEELQGLNEWRPGLLRRSFEPYALALSKERLFEMGARPVIYAIEDLFPDLSDDLRYLFQVHGSRGKNWSTEREWRIKGDLDLASFSSDELFVIAPEPEEATLIADRFNVRVGLAYDRPAYR